MISFFNSPEDKSTFHQLQTIRGRLTKISEILVASACIIGLIALMGYLFVFLSPFVCSALILTAVATILCAVILIATSLYVENKSIKLHDRARQSAIDKHTKETSQIQEGLDEIRLEFGSEKPGEAPALIRISAEERAALIAVLDEEAFGISLLEKIYKGQKGKGFFSFLEMQVASLVTGVPFLGDKDVAMSISQWLRKLLPFRKKNLFAFFLDMKLSDFPNLVGAFPNQSAGDLLRRTFLRLGQNLYCNEFPNLTSEIIGQLKPGREDNLSGELMGWLGQVKSFLAPSCVGVLKQLNAYLIGGLPSRDLEQVRTLCRMHLDKFKEAVGEGSPVVSNFFEFCFDNNLLLFFVFLRMEDLRLLEIACQFCYEYFFTRPSRKRTLADLEDEYSRLLAIASDLGSIKTDSVSHKILMLTKINRIRSIVERFILMTQTYPVCSRGAVSYLAVLSNSPSLQDFLRGFIRFGENGFPTAEESMEIFSNFLRGSMIIKEESHLLNESDLTFMAKKIGMTPADLKDSLMSGTFVENKLRRIFKKPR